MARRSILSALCLAALLFPARAEEALTPPDPAVLPFWEIGLSNMDVEAPELVGIPSRSGENLYYWTWRFRFKPVTSLEKVEEYLEQLAKTASGESTGDPLASPRAFYESQLNRVQKTLQQEKMANLFVAVHTDTGEIIPDTSTAAVRNYVERRVRVPLYTINELRQTAIDKLQINPETRSVEAIAIFPRLDPNVREFELRVMGMGDRFMPRYQPGELLYLERPHDATLRRAYRFTYRRFGHTGLDRLDDIKLQEKKADWVWIWPSHVYTGLPRTLKIDRESGLSREYRYLPYRIWNSTSTPQDLKVDRAGLTFRVVWRGQPIRLRMTDIGDADGFWKTQVLRQVAKRLASGEEAEFVDKHEKAQLQSEGEAGRADAEAKASIVTTAERHVRQIIDPLRIAHGLIIVRWGVDDIEAVVNDLVRDLRVDALVNAENESDLAGAYRTIRTAAPEGTPSVIRPPEPAHDEVVDLLVKLAEEDLAQQNGTVSEDDRRRYGKLAPIASLLNGLAAAEAQTRAEKGLVDVFFEVRLDDVVDRCAFPCQARRMLPTEREPFSPPDLSPEMHGVMRVATPLTSTPSTNDVTGADDGGEEKAPAQNAAPEPVLPW